MLAILVLERLRQGNDFHIEANLGYRVRTLSFENTKQNKRIYEILSVLFSYRVFEIHGESYVLSSISQSRITFQVLPRPLCLGGCHTARLCNPSHGYVTVTHSIVGGEHLGFGLSEETLVWTFTLLMEVSLIVTISLENNLALSSRVEGIQIMWPRNPISGSITEKCFCVPEYIFKAV